MNSSDTIMEYNKKNDKIIYNQICKINDNIKELLKDNKLSSYHDQLKKLYQMNLDLINKYIVDRPTHETLNDLEKIKQYR